MPGTGNPALKGDGLSGCVYRAEGHSGQKAPNLVTGPRTVAKPRVQRGLEEMQSDLGVRGSDI